MGLRTAKKIILKLVGLPFRKVQNSYKNCSNTLEHVIDREGGLRWAAFVQKINVLLRSRSRVGNYFG